MTLRLGSLSVVAAALSLTVLSGCFLFPQLEVTPKSLSFGTLATAESLTITNRGGATLSWRLEEVVRANEASPWIAQEIPWLNPETISGSTKGVSIIRLNASRAGQPVGEYRNTGVRITSNGGDEVIPISMTVTATLSVTPSQVALSPGATTAGFSVVNSGSQTAEWTVRYVPDPNLPSVSEDLPSDIVVSPNPGQTGAGQSTPVTIQWSNARQSDFYLKVESTAGSNIVSFLFGAVLEGLEVRPSQLTLYISSAALAEDAEVTTQPASVLRIGNTSAVSKSWTVEVQSRQNPTVTPAISVAPGAGSTSAGGLSEVSIAVTNAKQVLQGTGNYDVVVRSGNRFLLVPVNIEVLDLPVIAVSEPPQATSSRPEVIPMSVLDFGREDIQKEFWIANTGPRNSRLYFRITHTDQGVENPLIVDVHPAVGGANGEDGTAEDYFHPTLSNVMIDGRAITVTINRSNLVEDVEYRTITVQALDKDPSLNPEAAVLDAVSEVTLQIRVERQPLRVEGALNRSRPPYAMRFVFLLRDSLSKVIPTRTAADRARIGLAITENEQELPLSETKYYMTGPDNLKVNLIVMLDYTGSMYYAGTEDAVNPKAPGEVIAEVKNALKTFLDDLPPSYRVALMFYNDRQQQNRLIRAFTTDRSALKKTLDDFSLSPTQVGTSDIYDALQDGVSRLAAEDAGDVLPFDDADVRALMFISDGWDNASTTDLSSITKAAKDNKVRLYPLGYSPSGNLNTADLLVMAEDTGGHLYNAQTVPDLTLLLANEKGLTVTASDTSAVNQVSFEIGNLGTSSIAWQITGIADAPWITSVSPAQGTAAPGSHTPITVVVDPAAVDAGTLYQAILNITSSNGNGTAVVSLLATGTPPVATTLSAELRDDPGTIWGELQNQLVLTYITPKQQDFKYSIRFDYTQDNGRAITGFFEEGATVYTGDIRAGQIAMTTTGIFTQPNNPDPDDAMRAEVYVRADYVPRDVNIFKTRFFLGFPDDISDAARAILNADAHIVAELAPNGLLLPQETSGTAWRLISEGDGIYTALTSRANSLQYGAFGNLLKLTITGLRRYVETFTDPYRQPEFYVEMRIDNTEYISPAAPGHPSETKYMLYPAGPSNPGRRLSVTTFSDLAAPSKTLAGLAGLPFDPESTNAWDRDEDGLPDFNDPQPENDGLPGLLAVPNPLDIGETINEGVFTIRNNRLDTYTWSLLESSLPDWVTGLSYGTPPVGSPNSVLHPGDSETVRLQIDRTGLTPGTHIKVNLLINTDRFGQEILPTTLTVGAP